ncbi:hypothetical protein ISR94_02365 [Candidatus Microgenomates bacterium]|nr:hypothetical protein [Candidatus Microgenomates bacterium]
MAKRIELTVGQGTRELAHNLDFQAKRYQISREDPLISSDNLTGFETFVKEGKIVLHEAPFEANGAKVGDVVEISETTGGYWTSGDKNPAVYINDPKKIIRGTHKIVFRGTVSRIRYDDPETGGHKYGYSDKIIFLILERKKKVVAVRDW